MHRLTGYVAVLGLLFFMASCSTSKKTKTLGQPSTAVIAPTPIVEDTVIRLDTLIDSTKLQPSNLVNQIAPPLTPEENAWNMFCEGTNKAFDYAAAIHYDVRKPQFVIIHHTSQSSIAQTIRTFQLTHTKVSSHYVIGRDGRVVQMLNDYLRAWHAGKGSWGQITDMNSVSIGIELDNNGNEPFPDSQIRSLMTLLDTLKTRYQIPQKNFIGHSDFAPGRKDDPSAFFPWERLAQRGFGIWYNPNALMPAPANFNPIDALKLIGYDMSRPEAVIRVFKQKFIKNDRTGVLTDYDKMVLFDLYRKFY